MLNSKQNFDNNIERVKDIGGIYEALASLTTSIIDASDLLRLQIVMSLSAVDYYIHEITRIGMLEVFDGRRNHTNSFMKFQISMVSVQKNISLSSSFRIFLENEIREKHSYISFQHPDKIAEALRLFYPDPLWPNVAALLSISVNDVKERLKLIVDRRNKIVHEADMDPSFPNTRWPISQHDVRSSIGFIEDVCGSIHTLVT